MESRSLKPLIIALILVFSALTVIQPSHAQASLIVSTNVFSGFSLVEIVVIDPDISATDVPVAPPTVKANNVDVKMYQAVDGSWFGYIRVWCWADTVNANGKYDVGEPIIIDKDNDGKYDDGELVSGTAPPVGTSLIGVMPVNPPSQDPIEPGTGETQWTGSFTDVTTIEADIGDRIIITYSDLTQYVDFNWVEATISIDRDEYPPDAKAYITVSDQDLNQDPTSAETYTVDPVTGQTLLFIDRTRGGQTQTVYSGIQLVETGENTGVFEASRTLSSQDFTFLDVAVFRYEDQHPAATIKTSASILTYLGLVSFDSDSYRIGATATITLNETDLNLDSQAIDSAQVKVWSDTDKTGFNLSLSETDVDTGTFTGSVTFTTEQSQPQNNLLQVSSGDTVYVSYQDSSNDVGIAEGVVDTATIVSYTGSVSLDRDVYVPGTYLYITVSDPDENLKSDEIEVIPWDNYPNTLQWVTVESRLGGEILDPNSPMGVTCIETGPDTGVFEGKVIFQVLALDQNPTGGMPGAIPKLQVKPGATIKVRYYERIDEWGKQRETLVEAKFMTSSGSLELDSDSYPPGCTLHSKGGTIKIWVTDPDLNLSPNSVDMYSDKIEVDVKSPDGTSRQGYPVTTVNLVETGPDTGIFKGEHELSDKVERGNIVEVTYKDEYSDTGHSRNVKAYANILTHTGVLETDRAEVPLLTELTIKLIEPDWNFDSEKIDFIEAGAFGTKSGVDIFTETSQRQGTSKQIKLIETEPDSGIFEATIIVGQTIPASPGDTLTIRYNDEQDLTGSFVQIEKKIAIKTYTGEVVLDKEVYSCNDRMLITIIDPDRNQDPEAYDYIQESEVKVKSTSWPSPVQMASPLSETDVNSGMFTGTFRLILYTGQTTAPQAGTIYVYHGDGVTVTYVDPIDAEGNKDTAVTATAKVSFTTATVSFDKELYQLNETATITVFDPDANVNLELKDKVQVSVFSGGDPAGVAITLVENATDSGFFTGTVSFTEEASAGASLHVQPIDLITAQYKDETPNPADVPNYNETGVLSPVKVKAEAYVGALSQPEIPLTVTAPTLTDLEGKPLISAVQGEPVMLVSNITNVGFRSQSFLYIVQIKDLSGRVVYMSFIQGSIQPDKTVSLGIAWTPEKFGTYKVEVFTWESWEKPTPLSEPAEAEVVVAFKP